MNMHTHPPSAPLPVLRSTIHPDALRTQVLPAYDLLPPLTCGLLTQSVHDNYLVTAGGARYVLRVHRYEAELTLEEVEEQARIVAALDQTGSMRGGWPRWWQAYENGRQGGYRYPEPATDHSRYRWIRRRTG